MSARGERFTVKWRQPVYYSDFSDSFETNPTTGALQVLTNEESISASIESLVMTSPGERPGRNGIGSKVLSSLFANLGMESDPQVEALRQSVMEVIQNHEPRAQNPRVVVDVSGIQDNEVRVSVSYRPINLPQVVEFTFSIQRVR